jgi:hypothetical protein
LKQAGRTLSGLAGLIFLPGGKLGIDLGDACLHATSSGPEKAVSG